MVAVESSRTAIECAQEKGVVSQDEVMAKVNSLEIERDRAIATAFVEIEHRLGQALYEKQNLEHKLVESKFQNAGD